MEKVTIYPYEEMLCSIMNPPKVEMHGLHYTSRMYHYTSLDANLQGCVTAFTSMAL